MTETACLPTPAQLGLVLHRILVDVRNWALVFDRHPEGAGEVTGLDPKGVAALTDLAELIPLQFINRHEGYLEIIVGGLRDLAAKYPWAVRYAAVLEMSPDEVAAVVTPVGYDWAAPQAATEQR